MNMNMNKIKPLDILIKMHYNKSLLKKNIQDYIQIEKKKYAIIPYKQKINAIIPYKKYV
jgi:hypothetical protein